MWNLNLSAMIKKIESEDIAALIVLIGGVTVSILYPCYMGQAARYTIGGIIAIKMFW